MTRTAIRQAALRHFAAQGFNGASMAGIAADVGIKAPAIYAHYTGKTQLFLDVLNHAIERELAYAREFLAREGNAEDVLAAFLRETAHRFEETPHLRFMLNTAYLPPRKVAAEIAEPVSRYMINMEIIIANVFKRLPPCRIPPDQMAAAYMGIMDSVQAEVLYGGKERFLKRLDALWELFRLALT